MSILNILEKCHVTGKNMWIVDYGTLIGSAKESVFKRMTIISIFLTSL